MSWHQDTWHRKVNWFDAKYAKLWKQQKLSFFRQGRGRRKLHFFFSANPFNSFGAKFRTTFVVCFSNLTNYRLERYIYVKLKDWMSNSVDPDETAHWAVSSGCMLDVCCLQKPIIIAYGSERVKMKNIIIFWHQDTWYLQTMTVFDRSAVIENISFSSFYIAF